MIDGAQWVGLDPATGQPKGQPIDLGFLPVRPVQGADLDGDGEPEILAVGPGQAAQQQTLTAIAPGSGQPLWSAPIKAGYEIPFGNGIMPEWPLAVDLDGDGRSEIVVPDSGPLLPGDGYRGMQSIDGVTGRTRWSRPMRPETIGGDGIVQILDAPDLDHDGVRDLVATSYFLGRYPTSNHEGRPPVPERIYVDALSGKDGHPLWWWHVDTPTDGFTTIGPLRWWGRGPDGWPLLAVVLGGNQGPGGMAALNDPPIVYNLEASSGRQVHAAVGLTRVGVADLDGDGLTDLWGEADKQLRAFRGEAPELWRALGWFGAARGYRRWDRGVDEPAADLDGDGIADTMLANIAAALTLPNDDITGRALGPYRSQGFMRRNAPEGDPIGTRTAVARSGRDGHLIWKAELDPRRIWYERDHGESYHVSALTPPNADLDGDGTPDVIVQQNTGRQLVKEFRRLATLPIQVLSGRTGRPLWSAGPLPLGFEAYGYSSVSWLDAVVVESSGRPDLLVRHGSPFSASGTTTMRARSAPMPRLARVSGRDGRILWDLPLSEQPDQNNVGQDPSPVYGDLDGDGALEAVLVLRGAMGTMRPDHELRVVSLRHGKPLWSQKLAFHTSFMTAPQVALADLDGDHRPEVLVTEQPGEGQEQSFVLRAIDGRSGETLWSWSPGSSHDPRYLVVGSLRVAHFDDDGRGTVCLGLTAQNVAPRLVTLDARGHQVVNRELPADANMYLNLADINGDGRDELLVVYGGRIHAMGRDLKELWTSTVTNNARVEDILQGSSGRPGAVLISPTLALDGSDGRPRWAGHSPHAWWWSLFRPSVLDPGDGPRLPLLLSNGLGATVCRPALPTDPRGHYLPPRGDRVKPGLARDDPRWIRPLPWTNVVALDVGLTGLAAVTALALVNVVIPLSILRLAAGRRRWNLRLLMALPLVAAVPLTLVMAVEPLVPILPAPFPGSARMLLALGTLLGVPVVACAFAIGRGLVLGRWKVLLRLVGLTLLLSLIIGGAWLWLDHRAMPAIESYSWSGWYLVAFPGTYAVGILILIGWAIEWSIRLVTRLRPDRGTSPG